MFFGDWSRSIALGAPKKKNEIQCFFGLFALFWLGSIAAKNLFCSRTDFRFKFLFVLLVLGAVILEACGYVLSRAEFALLGLFELYLLVFWGVCMGGFFVRGGLWTLWILFSCGVGASLSVIVAEFCGGSGNLFCCCRR